MSDKLYFRTEIITRNRRTLYSDKRVNNPQRRYSNSKCVFAADNRIEKHVNEKLIELKGEMDRSTIIVQVFNTQITMDRAIRLRISKYLEFNNNINKQDLIDIYKIFHSTVSAYAFFSSVYAMLCYGKSLQPCPTLCDPMDCSPVGSSVHGIFPGENTGMGSHFLLQGIFLTQDLNLHLLCLLHWQADSLPLCHLKSPDEYAFY